MYQRRLRAPKRLGRRLGAELLCEGPDGNVHRWSVNEPLRSRDKCWSDLQSLDGGIEIDCKRDRENALQLRLVRHAICYCFYVRAWSSVLCWRPLWNFQVNEREFELFDLILDIDLVFSFRLCCRLVPHAFIREHFSSEPDSTHL